MTAVPDATELSFSLYVMELTEYREESIALKETWLAPASSSESYSAPGTETASPV